MAWNGPRWSGGWRGRWQGIISQLPPAMGYLYVRASAQWKLAQGVWVRRSGAWTAAIAVYVRKAGTWVKIFGD